QSDAPPDDDQKTTEYAYEGSTSAFCTGGWTYEGMSAWPSMECTPTNECKVQDNKTSPINVRVDDPVPASGGDMELKTAYDGELKHINITFNKFLYMTISDATPPTLQLGAVTYFLREVHIRFNPTDLQKAPEHVFTPITSNVSTAMEVRPFPWQHLDSYYLRNRR
ncbi:hypothetical protein V5799_010246, partial [Amblyomma americanum]